MSQAAPVQRANPTSHNRVAKGGALSILKNGSDGEYGVCGFADNRQCEEWAMLRGEYPVGGIRVTGYVMPARYCAITGGQYAVTGQSNTPTEQGACNFPNGKRCDAGAHYDGRCGR